MVHVGLPDLNKVGREGLFHLVSDRLMSAPLRSSAVRRDSDVFSASQLYMNHLKLQRYLAKGPAGKISAALSSFDQSCVKNAFFKF